MTIEMKKVWFDGEKVVTQNILESDIYKRHWDIASCKAYAEQLRDKNRANTAEHAAEAIEYLLALAQPEQEPVAWIYDPITERIITPQRNPLSDEEALEIARTFGAQPWPPGSCVAFARAIEAAHGIKGDA